MLDCSEVNAILCKSYIKLLLVISNLLLVLIQRLFGGLAPQTGTSFLVRVLSFLSLYLGIGFNPG